MFLSSERKKGIYNIQNNQTRKLLFMTTVMKIENYRLRSSLWYLMQQFHPCLTQGSANMRKMDENKTYRGEKLLSYYS